jgi:hypothetical protein
MNFAKRTGDLDEMVKHRSIRALVMMNPIGFFYERGIPKAHSTSRSKSCRSSQTRS